MKTNTATNSAAIAAVGNSATDVTTAAPAAPKTPSKKSLATAIFAAKLAERAQGLFATNKEFRAAVLLAITTDLGVSIASAATVYNSCKVESEAAAVAADPTATLGLGRDPKKEKPASTGKKGRPSGSKNATKEVAPADATTATVDAVADAVA